MGQTGASVSPMSNEGRNTYVREHITAALLQLLREEPLDAISVSQLCARAGVGRASFYRNFGTKEDVLRAHIRALFREWVPQGGQADDTSLSDLLYLLFAHFEKHRDFYGLLDRRGLVYLLKDAIVGLCGPRPGCPAAEAYARAYVAYALYGWVEVWFQRGMRETAEQIAGMFRGQGL